LGVVIAARLGRVAGPRGLLRLPLYVGRVIVLFASKKQGTRAVADSTTKPIHAHRWQVGFVPDGSVQVAIEGVDGTTSVFQFQRHDFNGFVEQLQDAQKQLQERGG